MGDIPMKLKDRPRVITGLLAVATALLSLGFFQGFETNLPNWFSSGSAQVNRVQTTVSTSYNSGTTAIYANGIGPASGTWLGQVKSSVRDGTCGIDTTGAIGPSLQCFGPFTDFGLAPQFVNANPFPTNGYTTQLAIYLDTSYALNHPDCTTAPCNPSTSFTSPTVNTECVPGPDTGNSCEGTRFDWDIGLNDPTGNFHRDYVFNVATAVAGEFAGCPSGGFVINASHNSFRSGANPYAGTSTSTLCLTNSGWYTFKQAFSNVSGLLSVTYSILNPDGSVATCNNLSGAAVDCTWTLSTSDDPIDSIGCPSYGWLANEEINDLPIDNTVFDVAPGACGTSQATAQITPTNTTCQQFVSGNSATLSQLTYTSKNSKIQSVSPGVFFYYTQFIATANQAVSISQSRTDTTPGNIPIQKAQAILYSSSCTKIGSLNVASDGTASGTIKNAGAYIIGVKYTPSSLASQGVPGSNPDTYTYDTTLGASEAVTASVDLVPRH